MKAPTLPSVAAPRGGSGSGPAEPDPRQALMAGGSTLLDERSLSKLKWRCRRGLLENDLFVERFFERHEPALTTRQAVGLQALMDLADNDLLDLLLCRKEPRDLIDEDCDFPEVHEVLTQMRAAPVAHHAQSVRPEERLLP